MLYLGLPASFVVFEIWLALSAVATPAMFLIVWFEDRAARTGGTDA